MPLAQVLADADPAFARICEVAVRLGLPVVDLAALAPAAQAVGTIPAPLARRLGVLPLAADAHYLCVALSEPADMEVMNTLEFLASRRIVPVLATADSIAHALSANYDRVEDEALVRSLGLRANAEGDAESAAREAERLAGERPVVKLVGDMIAEAVRRRASDIHLRPGQHDLELLYRIDGELVPVRRFVRDLAPALVSRIKVIGGMNIAERRLPQDGRATATEGERLVDLRISVLPTVDGESVVIRLLNTQDSLRRIDEIGFNPRDTQLFRDLLGRSHGMLLVTGPTGCGKSTTLYAALMEARKQNVNIITVEDPVEYHIPAIEQVQVNRAAGTTFARTLRNILRHDPDVIMVGEIRDRETAEIAVESALTGHLVLSTLHTNSAASAVTRLLDLGVESFLLRSTLMAVLAQRLARRNCTRCSAPEAVDPHQREVLGVGIDEAFRCGTGCAHCEGTGVRGRVAVYELLPLSAAVRRLVVPNADADAIHATAVAEGMVPITDHALALARAGVISLAEAFRIRVE
jgi:type IV pilus assembly protein PilB